MKKIFLFIVLTVFVFTGCDTEGEELNTAYNTLSVTFNPAGLRQDYRATLDGQEIGFSGAIVPKGIETGELEVFRKSDNVSVFKEEISPSEPIELIHPVDKDLAIYSADNYMMFTPSLLGDEARYGLRFKNWDMVSGEANYIPAGELPGEVTIVDKNNGDAVVFSYEFTQSSGNTLSILQLSETEFIELLPDNEPEPTVPNTAKVRFLYTGDAVLNMEEIAFNLYFIDINYDWASVLPVKYPLVLKKGKISEYVEFDMTDVYNNYYVYGINDSAENVIIDFWYFYTANTFILTADWTAVKYKKATIQIMDGGNSMTVLEGLSTLW